MVERRDELIAEMKRIQNKIEREKERHEKRIASLKEALEQVCTELTRDV